ncbi:hypothetical protein GCM10010197_10440 [Nocardioides luteus]|uniref:Uncharacterized protein n=1 Tax=Nocardioides luteus TaxID=1844 RepID=A0ABQ5SXL3_9ACTN|nr:hypothetical protein GCM10010197_10440 [Nocardioides luteus]GLJ68908.1 hypothetical protein GCM10017579_29440 [Nocardioides luteus]
MEGDLQTEPAVRVWRLRAYGLGHVEQLVAPYWIDTNLDGDVAVRKELRAAIGPDAMEIDVLRPFSRIGEALASMMRDIRKVRSTPSSVVSR